MTDYARVAQLLKEVDSFIDTADAPHLHMEYVEALTIAAALCDAYAQPVDEAKERAEFEAWVDGRQRFVSNEQTWLARARSDIRAKAAEAECERLRAALKTLPHYDHCDKWVKADAPDGHECICDERIECTCELKEIFK